MGIPGFPPGADRWLRWFVVTPDMHQVHHSTVRRETDSNFGFNLPYQAAEPDQSGLA